MWGRSRFSFSKYLPTYSLQCVYLHREISDRGRTTNFYQRYLDRVTSYNSFLSSTESDGIPIHSGIHQILIQKMRPKREQNFCGQFHSFVRTNAAIHRSVQNSRHAAERDRYDWLRRFSQCSSKLFHMKLYSICLAFRTIYRFLPFAGYL